MNEIEKEYFPNGLYQLIKISINIDCNLLPESDNFEDCEKLKRMSKDMLDEIEKCVECDNERRKHCKKCHKGYYVPKGIYFSQTRCKRCDKGCLECISDNETDESICLECNEEIEHFDTFGIYEGPYKLYNGKCIEEYKIGYKEECRSCNKENGKYDECFDCNDGYYLDINYTKYKCRKIEIENCTKAIIEYNNVKCTKCSFGYILHNNQCVKACNAGYKRNTCASCNSTYEFRDSCAFCHKGYFLYPYLNKTICKSCQEVLSYCSSCEYMSGEIKCTSCYSGGYLEDGKCILRFPNSCWNCVNDNGKWSCNNCKDYFFLQEIGGITYCNFCSKFFLHGILLK